MIHLLLDNGADVEATGRLSGKLWQIAAALEHSAVAELLKAAWLRRRQESGTRGFPGPVNGILVDYS